MKIIKRYKDKSGNIIGYSVAYQGDVTRVDLATAISLCNFVDNAILTSDGKYRARCGYKIRTEVLRISPQSTKTSLKRVKNKKCSVSHSYIDFSLVRDFSKKKKFADVYNDLKSEYRVTNVLNDDALHCIAKALYKDYRIQRCNYESYIEDGMDARLLMELRKSSVFYVGEGSDTYFYTGLKDCNTWQEVRQFRINFFGKVFPGYEELNWQYYYLVIKLCGKYAVDFIFDSESCFEDGDWRKQTKVEDYKIEFFNAHMPERLKIDEW